MSFELVIQKAKEQKLVYQVYAHEVYFIPSGRNYFTRVRCVDTDYYIEYCDDYKKPLDDKVIVVRKRDNMPISYDKVIVNHILNHPKNQPLYSTFNKVLKELDKQYHCEVVDNEAFVREHEGMCYTKFIGREDSILVEYYNERYIYLNKSHILNNDENIQKMVKFCVEIINCHPLNR